MRYLTTNIPLLLTASATLISAQDATITAAPAMSTSGNSNCANPHCYEDCPDDPDHFAAELLSEQICATDNAYNKGQTSVATTWTTPGANPAEATATGASTTTAGDGSSSTGGRTKAASTSEGAATVKAVGNLLAFLELGLVMGLV
ncbi:hypothetical protein N7474_004588 [Penicillium riverlandense]|uniref:uncharacterized protein n=1 Tax=Penicillium riverlandense TaxID=1903569 RepID=UPI0025474B7A|nr:uncharacterized protein N7474_004588 [Penicillium riverlandense]KAJ5818997.1 hypothetical protein N7474_004588 [Penicillium riverlandense]